MLQNAASEGEDVLSAAPLDTVLEFIRIKEDAQAMLNPKP